MTKQQKGFTLIELMISILLASVITAGTMSLFFSQNNTINADEIRTQNLTLSDNIFTDLNSLFRHAANDTIDIQYGNGRLNNANPELENDTITVDFSIPASFPIWPNNVSPFEKNWIRLKWENLSNSEAPYALLIGTASNRTALSNALLSPLNSGDKEIIIANLDIWPLNETGLVQENPQDPALGGYLLQVNTRTRSADPSYQNPKLPSNSPLAQHRTHMTSGIVSPRN